MVKKSLYTWNTTIVFDCYQKLAYGLIRNLRQQSAITLTVTWCHSNAHPWTPQYEDRGGTLGGEGGWRRREGEVLFPKQDMNLSSEERIRHAGPPLEGWQEIPQ